MVASSSIHCVFFSSPRSPFLSLSLFPFFTVFKQQINVSIPEWVNLRVYVFLQYEIVLEPLRSTILIDREREKKFKLCSIYLNLGFGCCANYSMHRMCVCVDFQWYSVIKPAPRSLSVLRKKIWAPLCVLHARTHTNKLFFYSFCPCRYWCCCCWYVVRWCACYFVNCTICIYVLGENAHWVSK